MTASPPDARLNAWRADLADERLRGRVASTAFVAGTKGQVRVAWVPVFKAPALDAERVTEAQSGEIVTVYERGPAWVWGQLADDGYVGYLPASAVMASARDMTHRVAVLATHMYAQPDIKSEVLASFSLNARIAASERTGRFVKVQTGGYVVERHLRPIGAHATDYVAEAELFLGLPYLWGGKTVSGIDCSGLVQAAMTAAGLDCPRDSDMQRAGLGSETAVGPDLAGLKRGDLLFWKGHVAIATDGLNVLHANAFHMARRPRARSDRGRPHRRRGQPAAVRPPPGRCSAWGRCMREVSGVQSASCIVQPTALHLALCTKHKAPVEGPPMRIAKLAAMALAAVVAALAAALAIGTATKPSRQIATPTVTPSAIDEQAAARRLAEGIRFKTVSFAPGLPPATAEFQKLHAHLAASFPKAHAFLEARGRSPT